MNRRNYTIMTLDDHRAAAREMATVHRSVAEFEAEIAGILDGRQRNRFAAEVCRRLRRNLQLIHRRLDRVQAGMREVQANTLATDQAAGGCWPDRSSRRQAAREKRAPGILAPDQHIAAAWALGPSQAALQRFLRIISLRRHLPVRIMDDAIRVLHLIQVIRCEMEDFEFYTFNDYGFPWVNYWLGPSIYYERSELASATANGAPTEVN